MTTSERRTKLVESFDTRATIVKNFGMTLTFLEDGRAVIDLPYNPTLNHALGGIHGGVIMTIIDSAAWFTSAAAHPEDIWVATSELSVHLLLPAANTSLQAVGRMVKSGKRQDIVEADVTDADGKLIARGIGTFIVLPNLPLSSG